MWEVVMCKPLWSALLIVLLVPSLTLAQSSEPKEKFEVGIQYSVLRLTRGAFIFGADSALENPRQVRSPIGGGGRTVYNLKRSWSLEAEMNIFPEQNVFRKDGDLICCGVGKTMDGRIVEVLAGTKVGQRWRRMGVYLIVRPGLLHFSKTVSECFFFPGVGFDCKYDKPRTDFVTDVGGSLETYVSNKLLVRLDMGDTIQLFRGLNETLRRQVAFAFDRDATRAQTYHNFQIGVGTSLRF